MKKHACRQFGDSVGVVHDGEEEDGACVLISRSVGNDVARALMRLSRDVLNGDYDAARDELATMEHRGYRLPGSAPDQPTPCEHYGALDFDDDGHERDCLSTPDQGSSDE